LHATLQGFLSGTGKLASRLDGFSMTGMCGILARLNLERSWNRCCSVSSSPSSEVSSMTTTSSPSPTSRRSFPVGSAFPYVCPSSREGKGGTAMYYFTSSYNTKQT
jgi:hypothetical protein